MITLFVTLIVIANPSDVHAEGCGHHGTPIKQQPIKYLKESIPTNGDYYDYSKDARTLHNGTLVVCRDGVRIIVPEARKK